MNELGKNETKEKAVAGCLGCLRMIKSSIALPILLTFEESARCEVCQQVDFITTIWHVEEKQSQSSMQLN